MVSDETLTRRTVFTDAGGKATVVALDPATGDYKPESEISLPELDYIDRLLRGLY